MLDLPASLRFDPSAPGKAPNQVIAFFEASGSSVESAGLPRCQKICSGLVYSWKTTKDSEDLTGSDWWLHPNLCLRWNQAIEICVFHSERSSTMSHRPWGKKASANLVRTALDLCSIHWVLNQLPSPNLCGLCRRHKISQTFKSYMSRCTVIRAGLLNTRIQVNCVYRRVKNDPFSSISPLWISSITSWNTPANNPEASKVANADGIYLSLVGILIVGDSRQHETRWQ